MRKLCTPISGKTFGRYYSQKCLFEAGRLSKLKDNLKGFHLEDSGTCSVCGQPAIKENSWYDKNGIKCMPWQKAVDKKLIPVSVVKNKESWYSKHDLESYFNIGRKYWSK